MRKFKLVIMLLFTLLLLVGCGKDEKIDEATKDAVNKGDSNNAVSLLVEYGIDLNSIKPEGTISTVTYEEAGEKGNGVIFYIDGESNRKEVFSDILEYFKIISSDSKIYTYKNKEYEYSKEVDEKTKEQEIIYKNNENSVKVHIEYDEKNCPKDADNDKCDTYGIVFE